MASFAGPKRRFDFHLKKDAIVLIDDYAHHPAELAASIQSVKELYAGRKVTGIFQPHLYTRTRDFAPDFGYPGQRSRSGSHRFRYGCFQHKNQLLLLRYKYRVSHPLSAGALRRCLSS